MGLCGWECERLDLRGRDAAAQGVGRLGLIQRGGINDGLGIGGGLRRLKQVRIRDPFPDFLADVTMVMLPTISPLRLPASTPVCTRRFFAVALPICGDDSAVSYERGSFVLEK